MIVKIVLSLLVVFCAWFGVVYYDSVFTPETVSDTAVLQVEMDDGISAELRTYSQTNKFVPIVSSIVCILVLCLIWSKEIMVMFKNCKSCVLLIVCFIVLGSSGCLRPIDKPVYVDIGGSETVFIIQKEGDNKQGAIDSEEYLEKSMVQTKRIAITYRWVDTGRIDPSCGYYIANEQVVIVDRQAETREWTAEQGSGTSDKDQAIWVESSDSVGFSTGINITARIDSHADAVKFLWNYAAAPVRTIPLEDSYKEDYEVMGSSLENIMDSEVRTKVQEVFSREAAKYDMDELRTVKNEIMDAVKEDVVPFFAERGITITAIGMFGGFTYENPKIQEAIDEVFAAQQDEKVAMAEVKAAEQRKDALMLMGEGEAQQAMEIAKGEAAAIESIADAKAYELEKLTTNPEAYLALKKIELEQERISMWDGKYPSYYIGDGLPGMNIEPMMIIPEAPAVEP